jgi:hypothetical protein
MEQVIDYKRVAQVWSERLYEMMANESEGQANFQKVKIAIAGLLREVAKEDGAGIFCSMAEIAVTAIETIREQNRTINILTSEYKKENKRLEDDIVKLQRMKNRAEHRAYLAEKRVEQLLPTPGSSESEFVVRGVPTTARIHRETVNGATSPTITTRWREEEEV